MVLDVVLGEGGDEVVGVIVTGLHAESQWMTSLAASCLEVLWLQLICEEVVRAALIDEDGGLGTVV